MKLKFLAGLALAVALATPALAALAVGAKAPDFTLPAYLAGKPFTFHLADALKKGPVVLYFFPAPHTGGCNIEAHLFAEAADDFKAQGATVIGVTAGNLAELQQFSAEAEHCSGKFPVAGDAGAKVAAGYTKILSVAKLGGDISDRTSFVIAPNGEVVFTYSAGDPTQHPALTLEAVKKWRAAHPK
ncbi:peroxiredoxin [Caulobacter ginsengisoli]|uniref:thioredoxin-dependent peroxiredoxin n=1 Tax=Caulobacter ginsengisoli TaxID=400775 RepID=A0ABU0ISU7_9CAUL|nr:peroxiredoxin [Caulobacter ginsengisoli]MDQ0464042.1 peroxiredoxin [Caulobacter ginsengisoli]